MTDYVLDNSLSEKDLIEFDLFNIMDQESVENEILIKDLETSEPAINYALRQNRWRSHAYNTSNGIRIGYGTTDSLDGLGLTEDQAYSHWIAGFKNTERTFKKIIGVEKMPQSKYDALVCLYFLTGDIKYTGSAVRKFRILEYIRNKQWDYVATALALSNNNKAQRQREASIMMLADYGQQVNRQNLRTRGIQEMRSLYPDRLLDDRSRRQVEYIYYLETGRFLPKLTMSRQRQIVNQANN